MSVPIPIIRVSKLLPFPQSPSAEAKAIVRHGFAKTYTDFERWYPEPIGPAPGTVCHAFISDDGLFLSDEMANKVLASIVFDNLANRPFPIVIREN